MPLVVMLHGCTQDPDDFAAGTGMNEAARERGFMVLYPAQSAKANGQRCWNWFKHTHQARGRGEPALLAGMTLDVIRRYPVDPARVYVRRLVRGWRDGRDPRGNLSRTSSRRSAFTPACRLAPRATCHPR